jgi:hypothetical protein
MKRELKVDKTNLSKHKKINIIRITAILKVKPDIANISVSLIEAGIFVIMSVEAFRTDYIVFICDVIMCFTSYFCGSRSVQ